MLIPQYLLSRFVSPIGLFFYFPTIAVLSLLEQAGLPTLQGSPDGWPMETAYGRWITTAGWWFFWSLLLAAIICWKSFRRKVK